MTNIASEGQDKSDFVFTLDRMRKAGDRHDRALGERYRAADERRAIKTVL
jgi:hypothetical protein